MEGAATGRDQNQGLHGRRSNRQRSESGITWKEQLQLQRSNSGITWKKLQISESGVWSSCSYGQSCLSGILDGVSTGKAENQVYE